MSDYVFEINPEQYLYKSSHKKCYFVVHKCRLPGKNKNLFLIGDAFLKHFYSVYDFDKDTVSLGIEAGIFFHVVTSVAKIPKIKFKVKAASSR